jgi:hypothetical protein
MEVDLEFEIIRAEFLVLYSTHVLPVAVERFLSSLAMNY